MKFKKIPPEYIKVILDRFIRIKPFNERLERVVDDIVNKFVISDFKREEKENLAIEAFNLSVDEKFKDDKTINNLLCSEENRIFKQDFKSFPNFNLRGAFETIKHESDLKDNLKWILSTINNPKTDLKTLREKEALLYPIEKIILCEGATEEILLCEFAKILNYNFKKEGVFVLGAGGKNQVARKYYKMSEVVKIPIFILLDADAVETADLITPKLKNKDKIYLIKNGEFEDILPKKLITEALNEQYKNSHHCTKDEFENNKKTTKELDEVFKLHGFGEFKKAEFARTVKNYICSKKISKDSLTGEIIQIVEEIKSL